MAMKKLLQSMLLTVILLLVANVCLASTYQSGSKDITNRYQNGNSGIIPETRDKTLRGCKLVGGSDWSMYYLDTSSCTYNISGGYAELACIVYQTGGGVGADGGPAKFTPYTYKFKTYKVNGSRRIFMESITNYNNGENATQNVLRSDNGFLRFLFWQVAKYTQLNESLD